MANLYAQGTGTNKMSAKMSDMLINSQQRSFWIRLLDLLIMIRKQRDLLIMIRGVFFVYAQTELCQRLLKQWRENNGRSRKTEHSGGSFLGAMHIGYSVW